MWETQVQFFPLLDIKRGFKFRSPTCQDTALVWGILGQVLVSVSPLEDFPLCMKYLNSLWAGLKIIKGALRISSSGWFANLAL